MPRIEHFGCKPPSVGKVCSNRAKRLHRAKNRKIPINSSALPNAISAKTNFFNTVNIATGAFAEAVIQISGIDSSACRFPPPATELYSSSIVQT
jgi:hypothetical protein